MTSSQFTRSRAVALDVLAIYSGAALSTLRGRAHAWDSLTIYLGIALSMETFFQFLQEGATRPHDPPVRVWPPDAPVTARPVACLEVYIPARFNAPTVRPGH